jgi:hypothetical protein
VLRIQNQHVVSTAMLWISPFYRNVLAALISLSITCANAEAPKQASAFGLALGQTPEAVQSWLTKQLPHCYILPSIYHQSEGYPPKVTAIFEVGHGPANVCRSGPGAGDIEDAVSVTFVHPSIAASQPLYQIDWRRSFPDLAPVSHAKINYSFDKTRAELFRTYGQPTDVREEKRMSNAANFARSLGLDKNVQREDKSVRYLWATKGRLPADPRSTVCDCGSRYVKAALEISRSPSTSPKNQYFVLSLSLFVRDADLGSRQDDWNAQWQQHKK